MGVFGLVLFIINAHTRSGNLRVAYHLLGCSFVIMTTATEPTTRIFHPGGVTDREALRKLMRYNKWQHDPYSVDRTTNTSRLVTVI